MRLLYIMEINFAIEMVQNASKWYEWHVFYRYWYLFRYFYYCFCDIITVKMKNKQVIFMSAFSAMLSGYVNLQKTNISSLSSESGIERTLLHKYISGSRTPSDICAVRSVADALMLSPQQKKSLCDSFRLTVLGEEGYRNIEQTEKILDFLSCIPEPEMYASGTGDREVLSSSAVSGRVCVDNVIKRLIRNVSSEIITVISPSDYILPVSELTGACIDRPETYVTHILDFEGKNGSNRNLKTFSDILPLIVYGRNYTPLICYEHPFTDLRRDSLLPCLVLTPEYAFAFSSRADRGILFTEKEYISVYRQLAADICSSSYSLIHKKITSVPKESDVTLKYNDSLFIENSKNCLSLIYSEKSFFSRILIYEQSLRNALGKGIENLLNG